MITTDRNEIAGFHTTKDVKEAIRSAAYKENISMSLFLHRAAIAAVQKRGYVVKDSQEEQKQ